MTQDFETYKVELPNGQTLRLQTVDEVEMWERSAKRYMDEYDFSKFNDKVLLGALLTQQLTLLRAQQKIAGMVPETDAKGQPTGKYVQVKLKAAEEAAAHKAVTTASEQIQQMEKSLAIDKKGRDAGGQQTLQDYLLKLKRAGHEYGVHITKRTKAYEEMAMELRMKLRMLRNGDAEDKAYHNISEASICEWAEQELAKLEEIDKKHARDKGRLWRGQL